MALTFSISIFQ